MKTYSLSAKTKIIGSICVLLIITFIAFSPSLKNGFTNWDDETYVTKNTMIKNLSWNNIKTIFTTIHHSHYQPLVLLSYAVEYYFFKLEPFYYHLTNFTLHLLNTVTTFWLIFLFSGRVITSFIVAILFGVHPLHVESVAWITERKDVLGTFFFLWTLICYLYYRKDGMVRYYYMSIFLFIISLLAKVMAVTIPVVLLLCDYLFYRKIEKKVIIEKVPFLVIGVGFGIITVITHYLSGSIKESYLVNFWHNVYMACYGLVFYLTKMMAPIKLSCLYPSPDKISGLFHSLFLFSPYIVIALIASIIFSARYTRKIIFGSLFFLITILPVLHLIPIGHGVPADRYTYIPAIGLFYIGGEFSPWLCKRVRYPKAAQTFLLIILIGIIGTLSFLTWQRCKVWKDSISLWGNVLQNYSNIPAAYNNRGIAYRDKGEYDKAISDYNQALEFRPDSAGAYINRGTAYNDKGEYDKAISDCTSALRIVHSAMAYNSRGAAYSNKGEYDRATADYTRAIRINPNFAEAYYNRGLAYAHKREYDKAISDYTDALRINPNFAEAYRSRAIARRN